MINISIIIPSYNSSKYIDRCICHLCRQTFAGTIELIFVDDCSTDNTIAEIKQSLLRYTYKGAYKVVAHQENKGAAAARVTGILNSIGEYILFCDSDDWMDDRMCEIMYAEALMNDSDLVVCDYSNIYDSYRSVSRNNFQNDFLQGLLLSKCSGSLCNKLIKRKLLLRDDFIYPKASFSEDYVYSIQLAIFANRINYVSEPLYNYCHRDGSLVTAKDSVSINRRIQENLENHRLVQSILQKYNLSERYYSESLVLKLNVKNLIRNYMPIKGYYKLWRKTYPEMTTEIFKSRYIGLKSKVIYFLTLFGLYTYFKKYI